MTDDEPQSGPLAGRSLGEHNPYSPPASSHGPRRESWDDGDDPGTSDYTVERRPVILCLLLTLVTFGLYPSIWMLRRARFLNQLDAEAKFQSNLPLVILSSHVLSWICAASRDAAPARPLLSLIAGVTAVIAAFRIARILRSSFARTGRFLELSTIATFFFGIYYLQYKINQAAELPARAPRRKKKKKKKATEAASTEPDASDEVSGA
jgi:hypothetical protein